MRKQWQRILTELHRDEEGISLVEMIVSIAILAIVGGAILSFFSFSMLQTRSVDEDGTVHMESQNAWNQMRNELQNANAGIYSDGKVLYVYTKNDANTKVTKTVYSLDSSKNRLLYNCYTKATGSSEWTRSELDTDQVFAGFVKSFEVTVTDAEGNRLNEFSTQTPHSLTVKMEMVNGGKSTLVERNVMFRNTLVWVKDTDLEDGL